MTSGRSNRPNPNASGARSSRRRSFFFPHRLLQVLGRRVGKAISAMLLGSGTGLCCNCRHRRGVFCLGDRRYVGLLLGEVGLGGVMSEFEHIRHKPADALPQPRGIVLVVAPLRSNVNLSRIARLAGCAGISRLYQCGPGKIDREIARDSLEVLQVVQRRTIEPVLEELHREGYWRVGLEQATGAKCLFDYPFPEKVALVIGNERLGIEAGALRLLDDVVEIPVYGKPLSYNVATATTMAVYEYMRQHR
jgi:tRNA G18 (ribose-2'-O)-methylase SpoU